MAATTFAKYTEQIVLLVDPATRKAIEKLARREKRSRADVVRELIEAGLEQRSQA